MPPRPQATIRPRRDEDLNKLTRILIAVHEQDGYPVEGVENPYSWLHLEEPLGAWVAELNGEIVGHVALTEPGPHDDAPRIWSRQTGRPASSAAVLGRLFVAKTARGCHLGSRLVQTATQAARANGRVPVLDVMEKDLAAIHTYQRLGWHPLGQVEHRYGEGQRAPALAFAADGHSE